jgi:hypothetical protein
MGQTGIFNSARIHARVIAIYLLAGRYPAATIQTAVAA